MNSIESKLFNSFMQKQIVFNDTLIQELDTVKQENAQLKERLEEVEAQLNFNGE